LKQPSVIELFNGDKPDATECMLMKVDDDGDNDGPGFDSTPAISSRNATTTVEIDITSCGRYGRRQFSDSDFSLENHYKLSQTNL